MASITVTKSRGVPGRGNGALYQGYGEELRRPTAQDIIDAVDGEAIDVSTPDVVTYAPAEESETMYEDPYHRPEVVDYTPVQTEDEAGEIVTQERRKMVVRAALISAPVAVGFAVLRSDLSPFTKTVLVAVGGVLAFAEGGLVDTLKAYYEAETAVDGLDCGCGCNGSGGCGG